MYSSSKLSSSKKKSIAERATEKKIILVVRRTRLDELIARFNTVAQAKFYVEHLGADFSDYQLENQQYKRANKCKKINSYS